MATRSTLRSMAFLTPIAVFCSLSFGGSSAGPHSSVRDPLLPAPAEAWWCYDHNICYGSSCTTYQYESFSLQEASRCCTISQIACTGGGPC